MPATQRVQRDRSSRPKALFALEAQQLLARGEARQAVELCKRGLAYYPTNPTGYVVLAQSYIQLDEKDRALNVLQDGYRRTGSDRLNELALELAGEREPAAQEEEALAVEAGETEADAIAQPAILPEPEAVSEEIGIGEIPIEEYPATEEDGIAADAGEAAEPALADMTGRDTAAAEAMEADAAENRISPIEPGTPVQEKSLLPEEPAATGSSEEPESVEEEVIAMEIEIAEIGPEEEIAEVMGTQAPAENPLVETSPAPGEPETAEPEPIEPEHTEPEPTELETAEPELPIAPAGDIAPAEEESLPEALPAAEPAEEIVPEPETIVPEESGIIEPAPEEEVPAETAPLETPTADAVPSIEEAPATPPAADAPELPDPVAPEEEYAAEEPEEKGSNLIDLAPLEPAEALAAAPDTLVEAKNPSHDEVAVASPAPEPTPEPVAENIPAGSEPVTEPDAAVPPMPEPPAEELRAEDAAGGGDDSEPAAAPPGITEPLPAALEPVTIPAATEASPAAPEPPAEEKSTQEMTAEEPAAPPETPAMPPMPLAPEPSLLSIRSRPSGGEERVMAGRRENIVQLGSQQPTPLHTTEPQRPQLRSLEGRTAMEADTHRAGGGASQGTIQERPRPLALHMGKNISRLRSSNLRLIPGLEFAPLRHEDQARKQSIAPLISEPMPMPVADPSFRTQRPLEEKEINLPPLPPLVNAEPASEQLQIGAREPEPAAAPPPQAAELERPEDLPAEELQLPGWKELIEELEAPAAPEPAHEPEPEGEADPFAGNIFQMVQAVQKSAELTPLEELARRLENARIPVVEEVTEHRPVFTTSIVSETLANILVSQGAFAEALKAFQTLARTKPERFDYFQERIWEMKWRISNPDLSWPPEEISPQSTDPTA